MDEGDSLLIDASSQGEYSLDYGAVATLVSPSRITQFRTYKERWYILAVFSIMNVVQSASYNTFGPIAKSSVLAFNLTQTDVALLPNWANIVYFLSIVPFVYLINNKGLRLPVLLTVASIWAGAAVRIFHFGSNYRPFLHLGQFLNGVAGPVLFFACTVLSSVWFPPHERTLATGISMLMGGAGSASSYIIGPLFVQWFSVDKSDPDSVRHSIVCLLTFEFVVSFIILVVSIYSFRSKPPTPPSFTATVERTPLGPALKAVFSSRDCWCAVIVFSVSAGIWSGWLAILSWVVRDHVSEVEAGWLGFAAQVAGVISGISVSGLASRFQRQSKLFVILTMTTCALMATWQVVTFNIWTNLYTRWGLWVCVIGITAVLVSGQPLLWELCCELSYPAPESIVSSVLSLGNSLFSGILLVVAMVPSLGTQWMNWAVVTTFWCCIPLLLFYNPVQRRSALDVSSS